MKTKVLGLGNKLISDDAVGLLIAENVKNHCQNPDVTISCSSAGGFRLLDEITGFDYVIIVDAIISATSGAHEPHMGTQPRTFLSSEDPVVSTSSLNPHSST